MPAMRGQLSDTSVPDLCRGLSDAHATGALEIEGEAGIARIFFRSGFVYWAMSPAPRAQLGSRLVNAGFITSAQLEDTLERQQRADTRTKLGALLVDEGLVTQDVIRVFVQEQILDALFDTMRWSSGAYSFHSGDAVAEKLPVDIPVAELLVAVARRLGEWDQVQRVIPDLDAVPDHVTGKGGMATSLEPDEFAVLASIDGIRSVSELAADLGYSEFEAARIIYGLTLLGVVEIEDADEDEGTDELEAAAAEAGLEVDLDVTTDDAATEEVAPEPATAAYEVPSLEDGADDEAFDVGAALEAALTEPEPLPPAEVNTPPADEPQPWVADGVEDLPAAAAPATDELDDLDELVAGLDDVDTSAPDSTPTPEPVGVPAGADTSDYDDLEDFDDLFSDDAGADEVEAPAGTEDTEDAEPADDPAPAPSAQGEPRSAAQVSELLRELSRLTLDDDGDTGGSGSPEPPPPSRRKPRDEPDEPDDGGKKRRLFGWGG